MNANRIGTVAGVMAIVTLLVSTVPAIVLRRWIGGDPGQGPVPLFGTVGITVSAYWSIVDIIGVVVPIALGIVLGVWIGRHDGTTGEMRRGLRAATIGSAVAVLLATAIPVVIWSAPADVAGVGLFVVVVQHLVSASLVVTDGAFAGAALEQFEFGSAGGKRPNGKPELGATP
ncbi:MAG: hypothetical protein V5A38_13545 [Halolamina sp.]|uniref:hypothetical protein n=1 Tax=Halolamina sp. TaxID=1940283 RepID=UPI002FC27ADD